MENNSKSADAEVIKNYQEALSIIFKKIPDSNEPLIYMVASEIGFEILDLKLSINALLESDCYAGILALSRTMLENYIYLRYILEQDSFKRSKAYQLNMYRDMKKQYNSQKNQSLLKKLREQDHEFSIQIDLYEQNKSEIENYLKELDSLYGHELVPWYNDDKRTKALWKLFERVGMSHLYEGVYRYLCMETHGNHGLKHFKSVDGATRLVRTNLDEKQISSITCSILDKAKKELAKLIN